MRSKPRYSGIFWEWALVGILGLLLYMGTLTELVRRWMTDPALSHGPLVPVIAFVLIRLRAPRLATVPASPNRWGFALLLLAVALHLLSTMAGVKTASALTIPIFVSGLVLWHFGVAWLREMAFPLAFLLFMMKLPASLTDPISVPLQLLASRVAALVGHGLGIPVIRDGVVLNLPQFQLLVAEACSGLNMLTMLVALAALVAYLTPCRPSGKVLLLISAIPLALIANSLRVTSILLIAWYWGGKAAMGYLHTGSGIVMFLAILVPLLCLGRILTCKSETGCAS